MSARDLTERTPRVANEVFVTSKRITTIKLEKQREIVTDNSDGHRQCEGKLVGSEIHHVKDIYQVTISSTH